MTASVTRIAIATATAIAISAAKGASTMGMSPPKVDWASGPVVRAALNALAFLIQVT